jgi:predicted transcriptional regulator
MFEWIKKTKTRCSAMLIEADSVERKLKGISQLKELFEMTLVVSEYTMYQLSSKEFM